MSTRRLVIGLLLVCLGGVYLAEQAGWIDNPDNLIADWWPLAIIVIAAVTVVRTPERWPGALVLALIGGALLANTTDAFDIDGDLIWPLLLIGLGATVLLGRGEGKRGGRRPETAEGRAADHNLADV